MLHKRISNVRDTTCVIALDPSINTTGYAIRLKGGSKVSGTIKSHGNGTADRLFSLREQISFCWKAPAIARDRGMPSGHHL